MFTQSFEIKVALLGHVSAGKTTVLNALLQDKFSEVSKRRTTAGVNHFQLSFRNKTKQKNSTKDTQQEEQHFTATSQEVCTDGYEDTYSVSSDDNKDHQTSNQTLGEITEDNSILRQKKIIQEKFFSVEIDEPFLQMGDSTKLILVDIPGVNEAGSSELYLDYVRKSWDGFDVVIVVMDAIQGVNTEEQVQLLQFVKDNQDKQKEVPVIILANKVDDPDDEEVMELVKEVRLEVERIFSVEDREKTLSDILSSKNKANLGLVRSASPAFIPISAENGFLYRAASHMQLSNFNKFDMTYIDKIGHEEIGKFKWKKLTREQKYDAVYKVVSDPDQYKERLAASNFDKFLSTLDYFIGGDVSQKALIGKQLDVAMKKLSQTTNIAGSLLGIYDKCKAINKPTAPLKDKFWSLFAKCYDSACASFSNDPACIDKLHRPMKEVMEYSKGLHKKLHDTSSSGISSGKGEDAKRITDTMKGMIKMQCDVILKKKNMWTNLSHTCQNPCPPKTLAWNTMSPRDWTAIIHSILLMVHNKHFHENFSKEIVDLQWALQIIGTFSFVKVCAACNNGDCKCKCHKCRKQLDRCSCGNNHKNKRLKVTLCNDTAQIQVPDNLDKPNHWGHLAWNFCQFMDSNN